MSGWRVVGHLPNGVLVERTKRWSALLVNVHKRQSRDFIIHPFIATYVHEEEGLYRYRVVAFGWLWYVLSIKHYTKGGLVKRKVVKHGKSKAMD